MAFNIGKGEATKATGGAKRGTRLPEEGDHESRIRSIIKLGPVEEIDFQTKQSKGVHEAAVVVFELMGEDDFEEDGTTRMTIAKDFFLKDNEKSAMNNLINTFNPEAESFEDLIGAAGTVGIRHSKDGKHANMVAWTKGGIASLPKKFKAMVEELSEGQGAVGFVEMDDIDEAALNELHSINHVAKMLMVGEEYLGSGAEKAVEAIRAQEGRENFAVIGAKSEGKKEPKKEAPKMDEDEEY